MSTGRPDYTLGMDIVAQSIGNLPIDIAALTVGAIDVDIIAASIGNLGIDINAQSIGNIDIDITAQTIDRIYMLPKAPAGISVIVKSATAVNEVIVLHTVTAGKVFYLTYANLSALGTGAPGLAHLAVSNTVPTVMYSLAMMYVKQGVIPNVDGNGEAPTTASLPTPISPALPIAAGWQIFLRSWENYVYTNATITGWEEDA